VLTPVIAGAAAGAAFAGRFAAGAAFAGRFLPFAAAGAVAAFAGRFLPFAAAGAAAPNGFILLRFGIEGIIDEPDAAGVEPLDAAGIEPLDAAGIEPLDAAGIEPPDPISILSVPFLNRVEKVVLVPEPLLQVEQWPSERFLPLLCFVGAVDPLLSRESRDRQDLPFQDSYRDVRVV